MGEKIPPESSWNLPPTGRQMHQISILEIHCGIREDLKNTPSNRREARNRIYDLRELRKARKRRKRTPFQILMKG